MTPPVNEEQQELASADAVKIADSRNSIMRAALVVGLVSSLASLAGSKAAHTLSTAEVIGFLSLVGVMVLAELIFTEPMKDALAALFDLKIEQRAGSIIHRVGRLLTLVLGISVAILLEKMFSEHPLEAAVVAVQSLIVPTVITYAWFRGAKRVPRKAARYGASSGVLLGASFGFLGVFTIWLLCLFGSVLCTASTHQILGIPDEVLNTPSAGGLIPLLTLGLYLPIFSIAMAVLLGLAGSAGVLVDRLWDLGPRRALAIAAVVANIPFFIVALITFSHDLWVIMGGSVGGTLGWAGAFSFRHSVLLP